MPDVLIKLKVRGMKSRARKASRREHERIPVTMPVHAGAIGGTTRDVSVGGMYLELEGDGGIGAEITFEVEVESALGKMLLKCTGEVIRKEQKDGRTGLAVRVLESTLQARD